MNACEGGCINGPAIGHIDRGPFKRIKCVKIFARHNSPCRESISISSKKLSLDFDKHFQPIPLDIKKPKEEDIRRILETTGKYRPEHELNCGACGYNSCREKAEAVSMAWLKFTCVCHI